MLVCNFIHCSSISSTCITCSSISASSLAQCILSPSWSLGVHLIITCTTPLGREQSHTSAWSVTTARSDDERSNFGTRSIALVTSLLQISARLGLCMIL